MRRLKSIEQTHFKIIPHLGDLELLHARYVRQSFNRHFHRRYAIGVIESGAMAFDYRGEKVVAKAGEVNLTIPGETHNGFPASVQGWQYRMFYLDPVILVRAAEEMAGKPMGLPFFKQGVIQDPVLAAEFRNLHQTMLTPGITLLEQETRLLTVLARMIAQYAQSGNSWLRIGNESGAVARGRDYISDNYARNISLESLSRVAGLSRYHFIKVFQRETGLTPHAYLSQVRAYKAKHLLAMGETIVQAALETGFVDQSHLTRIFKRTFGVTPGKYRKSIQY